MWPICLSIGNINKATQCQISVWAMILVGYILISKLECYTKVNSSVAGDRLFHHCMKKIFEGLKKVGRDDELIVCADECV